MSEKEDGGWAFPVKSSLQSGCGMTLRQWYKGMCAAGLLAKDTYSPVPLVRDAADMADALIAEDKEYYK